MKVLEVLLSLSCLVLFITRTPDYVFYQIPAYLLNGRREIHKQCLLLWPSSLFFLHIFLVFILQALLPQATRGAYQQLLHLAYCYQPGLVLTQTHSLCPSVSVSISVFDSVTHTNWGMNVMGLISVLRALAHTSQSQGHGDQPM